MGRPDDSIICSIKGYKFKKAKYSNGDIHVISPNGINFTFDAEVMKEFVDKITTDTELANKFKL